METHVRKNTIEQPTLPYYEGESGFVLVPIFASYDQLEPLPFNRITIALIKRSRGNHIKTIQLDDLESNYHQHEGLNTKTKHSQRVRIINFSYEGTFIITLAQLNRFRKNTGFIGKIKLEEDVISIQGIHSNMELKNTKVDAKEQEVEVTIELELFDYFKKPTPSSTTQHRQFIVTTGRDSSVGFTIAYDHQQKLISYISVEILPSVQSIMKVRLLLSSLFNLDPLLPVMTQQIEDNCLQSQKNANIIQYYTMTGEAIIQYIKKVFPSFNPNTSNNWLNLISANRLLTTQSFISNTSELLASERSSNVILENTRLQEQKIETQVVLSLCVYLLSTILMLAEWQHIPVEKLSPKQKMVVWIKNQIFNDNIDSPFYVIAKKAQQILTNIPSQYFIKQQVITSNNLYEIILKDTQLFDALKTLIFQFHNSYEASIQLKSYTGVHVDINQLYTNPEQLSQHHEEWVPQHILDLHIGGEKTIPFFKDLLKKTPLKISREWDQFLRDEDTPIQSLITRDLEFLEELLFEGISDHSSVRKKIQILKQNAYLFLQHFNNDYYDTIFSDAGYVFMRNSEKTPYSLVLSSDGSVVHPFSHGGKDANSKFQKVLGEIQKVFSIPDNTAIIFRLTPNIVNN